MGEYHLRYARSAQKELERLDDVILIRIIAKIETLIRDPRPAGSRKIKSANNLWRVRVGDYRIIYNVYDKERVVDISAVRHRSIAYR